MKSPQKSIIKNGSKFHKPIAFLITLSIIAVLIMAGPATALNIGLSAKNGQTEVEQGKKITFVANVDLENGDKNVPIENITITIMGIDNNDTAICTFDVTGKKLKIDSNNFLLKAKI